MMPKKDGFEVTQTLKQNAKTSHIPIILLTAKATKENKLMGLKYGADAYLMKPFDKTELIIRVEKLVELRNRLQAFYAKEELEQNEHKTSKTNPEVVFLQELSQIIKEHLAESDFSVPQIASALSLIHI